MLLKKSAHKRGLKHRYANGLSCAGLIQRPRNSRSEEHTSELQSLLRIWYAVFCWKKKTPRQCRHTIPLHVRGYQPHHVRSQLDNSELESLMRTTYAVY